MGAGGAAWEGGLFSGPSCPARTAATSLVRQRPRERTAPSGELLLPALAPRWPETGLAEGTCSVEERKGVDHRAGRGPAGMPGTRAAQTGPAGRQLQSRASGPSRRLWLAGRERRAGPAPSAPEAHLPRSSLPGWSLQLLSLVLRSPAPWGQELGSHSPAPVLPRFQRLPSESETRLAPRRAEPRAHLFPSM